MAVAVVARATSIRRSCRAHAGAARKWWEYLMPMEAYDPAARVRWRGPFRRDDPRCLCQPVSRDGRLPDRRRARAAAGPADGRRTTQSTSCSIPLIQILRPIPPIAFIPLAILWFGLGNPPAIFLIALGAFFPVLMNTIAGVRNVDGIYIRAARNLGASQTDDLPAGHPAGGDALYPGRHAHRHRHRLHRGDRGRDDRGQQRPRLPHPGGARVLLVGQDHRRHVHHRPARPGHRHRHEPPQQSPAALAPRAREHD